MWDAAIAKRLDDWYATPEGSFALGQEYHLFQRLVSRWPRRNHSLLDVCCGAGRFLQMFWEYGFDVTGIDPKSENINLARHLMGNRVDFHLGVPDLLPFEDNSFNYVALISVLEYSQEQEQILTEAMRVAENGVIIGFMNSWSLYYFQNLLAKQKRTGDWLNVFSLKRMVKKIYPDSYFKVSSALFGTPASWHNSSKLNKYIFPIPIGAFVGVCIELTPFPLTPILLPSEPQRTWNLQAAQAFERVGNSRITVVPVDPDIRMVP